MTVLPTEAQNQVHVEYFMDIEDYFEEIVLSECFVSRSTAFGLTTIMYINDGYDGLVGRVLNTVKYLFVRVG